MFQSVNNGKLIKILERDIPDFILCIFECWFFIEDFIQDGRVFYPKVFITLVAYDKALS